MPERPQTISIIVAMSENRVIGRAGDLPWHISADLKRFKRLTVGHTIVMGRKTYDSIGRPLPERRSIVISRNSDFSAEGVEAAATLDDALRVTADEDEVFIIGGSSIYALALPIADRLYVTRVHTQIEGDVFFPPFDELRWQLADESPRELDERSGLEYSFLIYSAKDPAK
jgi:dihydrofolate reductase